MSEYCSSGFLLIPNILVIPEVIVKPSITVSRMLSELNTGIDFVCPNEKRYRSFWTKSCFHTCFPEFASKGQRPYGGGSTYVVDYSKERIIRNYVAVKKNVRIPKIHVCNSVSDIFIEDFKTDYHKKTNVYLDMEG